MAYSYRCSRIKPYALLFFLYDHNTTVWRAIQSYKAEYQYRVVGLSKLCIGKISFK
jgi:hypothetical protein